MILIVKVIEGYWVGLKEIYHSHVFFNVNSHINDIPDLKHFSNVFNLTGKNKSVVFLAKSK